MNNDMQKILVDNIKYYTELIESKTKNNMKL